MHSPDPDALFIISVAARIVGMHANTLRKYERQGLITPSRSEGNVRLFSQRDLARLRQIKRLVDDHRVNLAGVEVALAITDQILALRQDFTNGQEIGSEDFCRAIDNMLDTLSALPSPEAAAGHPQEDADERRKAHTRRRAPTARRGRGGIVDRRRSGAIKAGTGGRPGEVPDVS